MALRMSIATMRMAKRLKCSTAILRSRPSGARGGGGGARQEAAALAASTPADAKIKAAAAVLAKTKKNAAVRQKEEREWKDETGPVLKEEFLKFGNDAVKPGYDYYLALYNTIGGELYEVKRAYHAGSVFDPLKLKSMSVDTIELLIDDLVCFGFPKFTDEFLKGMKKELPLVIEHAHKPFDFGSVPGAAEYDASLARRLKLKETAAAKGGGGGGGGSSLAAASVSSSSSAEVPAVPVAADDDDVVDAAIRTAARVVDADKWENDPAEKARRIWEWWVTRANDTTKFFNFWPTALRLVVLVQPSSAFVERVFSQIKLIIEQIGVSCLEETVEARTMVRCNNKM
jgi:hypothetical protein